MSLNFELLKSLEAQETLRKEYGADVLSRPGQPTSTDPEYVPAPPGQGSFFWESLRTLDEHKVLIVAIALLTVAAVTLWSFLETPVYEASGTISIGRNSDSAFGLKDVQRANWDEADVVELDTQADILRSDTLAGQTIKALDLQHSAHFVKEGANEGSQRDAAVLERFKRDLEVSRLPRSRIVEVAFRSPDPRLSANVVNMLTNLYMEQNYKSKSQSNKWIAQQIEELKKNLEASQEKLVAYQRANGIFGLDDKANTITSALDQLNKEYTASIADRIQKEANYRLTTAGDPELLDKTDSNSLLPKLEGQKADITAQIALRKTTLGPAHPKMRELSAQLRDIESSIQSESSHIGLKFAKAYATAREREQMLRAAVENQKNQTNELSEKAIEYNILKHDVDANRQLYDLLLAKLKEAGVAAGLKSGNIAVIDPAQPPSHPSSPKKVHNILMALLMGLMGGIALAFLLEKIDCRFRRPEQIESLVGLPCLGVIPSNRTIDSNGRGTALLGRSAPQFSSALAAYCQPKSRMTESFRALRTRISLSARDYSPRTILVTSSLPREGKTMICLNLGIVLAQAGRRVVIVDADLRMSGLSKALSLDRTEHGLSTVLTGEIGLQEVIVAMPGLAKLQIVPAGPNLNNAAELINSRVMAKVIETLKQPFDDVIIDSPPALSVADALVLSTASDMVVLVARVGSTLVNALIKTRSLLAAVNAPLAGVVVNGVNGNLPDRMYFARYSNCYYDERVQPPPKQ
jgi:succinoglycan biosynthesis transport protein ExoP